LRFATCIFEPKFRYLNPKIKVAAVSYLNTKPLLYGIETTNIINQIDLILNYPSKLAQNLKDGLIDMALLPVAAIPHIPNARIVGNYGIAADGHVASVAIFSKVPMTQIKQVYLDYQSRTSVKLAQILLKNYWHKDISFLQADENYINHINGNIAAVIIGDRALQHLQDFPYVYDLAEAWKAYTGLHFVFAAWVANKDLDPDFIHHFDGANAIGLKHIPLIVAQNPYPYYDLNTYYTKNIKYFLDEPKLAGMQKFLELLKNLS
jgi:chorismate dehydratase